jgi:hypothetical protein
MEGCITMGLVQNDAGSTKPKRAKAYQGSLSPRRASNNPTGAEILGETDPGSFIRCVRKLAERNCAILVGTTRDGGALAVTLFAKDDRRRFYLNTVAQVEVFLEDVETWASEAEPDLAWWEPF